MTKNIIWYNNEDCILHITNILGRLKFTTVPSSGLWIPYSSAVRLTDTPSCKVKQYHS